MLARCRPVFGDGAVAVNFLLQTVCAELIPDTPIRPFFFLTTVH